MALTIEVDKDGKWTFKNPQGDELGRTNIPRPNDLDWPRDKRDWKRRRVYKYYQKDREGGEPTGCHMVLYTDRDNLTFTDGQRLDKRYVVARCEGKCREEAEKYCHQQDTPHADGTRTIACECILRPQPSKKVARDARIKRTLTDNLERAALEVQKTGELLDTARIRLADRAAALAEIRDKASGPESLARAEHEVEDAEDRLEELMLAERAYGALHDQFESALAEEETLDGTSAGLRRAQDEARNWNDEGLSAAQDIRDAESALANAERRRRTARSGAEIGRSYPADMDHRRAQRARNRAIRRRERIAVWERLFQATAQQWQVLVADADLRSAGAGEELDRMARTLGTSLAQVQERLAEISERAPEEVFDSSADLDDEDDVDDVGGVDDGDGGDGPPAQSEPPKPGKRRRR